MEHCETCGKLIDAARGQTECLVCRLGEQASESPPLAEDMALPVLPEFSDPITPEVEAVEGREDCVRCRKHAAMVDSEFCLACQLELLSMLGSAAHELFEAPAPPPKVPVANAVSLMNDVEEKRARTATSRIRVVGGVKIK